MKYLTILLLTVTGCATATPNEARQQNVLTCIKELKQNDSKTLDAFEVCRQVYGLSKVKE